MVRRLFLLAAANLIVLTVCILLQAPVAAPHPEEKLQAVATAEQAQAIIGGRLSGPEYTLITTTLAPHRAKQLSLHPDFAAVFVDWLTQAGAGPGMRVAVNLSGSFPALNISVLAAIRAIGAEPVITSSVGASTWGATDPEFTWLDMERQLLTAGLWNLHSAAASIGGVGDRGGGLTPEGKALALAAIERSQAKLIAPATLQESIEMRLAVYRTGNGGELPPILVNVGGNHVIFGEGGHQTPLPEGINFGYHPLLASHDGLAAAFLRSNRPVIHVINIAQIAARYNIDSTVRPGGSGIFQRLSLSAFWRIFLGCWILANGLFLWRGRTVL